MATRNAQARPVEGPYFTSTERILSERIDRYRYANRILIGVCVALALLFVGALGAGCDGPQPRTDILPVVQDAWAASKLEAERAVEGEPLSERQHKFLQENFQWWDQMKQIATGKKTD